MQAAHQASLACFGFPVGRPPLEFNFDRPFIFDIVHQASGLELFTGEIYVPEKTDASPEG